MWSWLCAIWLFLTENQTQYDAFARSHHQWWRGLNSHSRQICRDESEALEQLRDRWRR